MRTGLLRLPGPAPPALAPPLDREEYPWMEVPGAQVQLRVRPETEPLRGEGAAALALEPVVPAVTVNVESPFGNGF